MPDKKLSPPSKEFMNAIVNTGSLVATCELCGRIHFADNPNEDFNEGELEELRKKHETNPDKYIAYGDGTTTITYGYLDGKSVVDGCPCNKASLYENLYWNDRHIIAKYFEARAKITQERAASEKSLAGRVIGALDNLK